MFCEEFHAQRRLNVFNIGSFDSYLMIVFGFGFSSSIAIV
jgi:hypothetical protein